MPGASSFLPPFSSPRSVYSLLSRGPRLKLCLRPARRLRSMLRRDPLDIKAVESRYYMSQREVSSKYGINVSNENSSLAEIVSLY